MRTTKLIHAATIAAGFCAANSNASHPTARNPLADPYFAIDLNSPEVINGFRSAGDVLIPPGPIGFPTVVSPRNEHSLFSPLDHLDGLSDISTTGPTATFAILFSVNRNAIGAVPPDPGLIAAGFPFNVQDQAAKNQAAGDLFVSTLLFNRMGPALFAGFRAIDNNTLVFNQNDAGGVDYNVSPTTPSPDDFVVPGTPTTNVDATGGAGAGLRGALAPYFFTVSRGSPSLAGPLPGTGSGADIYVDLQPNLAGGEQLYASPQIMGLVMNDDVNSLIVFDDGDRVFESGIDQILFTLDPASPSLGTDLGPGDILVSRGNNTFNLFLAGTRLGIRRDDVLDALDWEPCTNIASCINDWAIGRNCDCPADTNCDNVIDLVDLTTVLASFGFDTTSELYNERADFDLSGSISLNDLAYLLSRFGNICDS